MVILIFIEDVIQFLGSNIKYAGLFQKKKTGGLGTYFFENPLWNISFFYPWNFQVKQSSTPGNSTKLC